MQTIGCSEAYAYFGVQSKAERATNSKIRGGEGTPVSSYLELAKKIAELQFLNPQYVLMFRGQSNDYKNDKQRSTLKPSLFRHRKEDGFRPPGRHVLEDRFSMLRHLEERLVDLFRRRDLNGKHLVARYRLLRWSILQHYEVCSTPLLDVTHSIRVAASFASDGAEREAFLYVLAVPNISGVVTASAESGLQIVKLSGICPPMAVRPHIQEGYLMGEYPDMPDFEQKRHYEPYEIDFARRLIGKFKIDLEEFWRDRNFGKIPRAALYPDGQDELFRMIKPLLPRRNQEVV